MNKEQKRLLKSIRERAIANPGLRQTIQFFMISNQNNDLVRQIWRHNAFMISLSSSKSIDVSIDDNDFIPSTHKLMKLKRKKSSGLITHHLYNDNKSDSDTDNESNSMELDLLRDIPQPPQQPQQQRSIKRRKSFTTDDLNIEELQLLLSESSRIDIDKDYNDPQESKENVDLNRMDNVNSFPIPNRNKINHRRRFTRSYIQQFNDNVEVFRWMLDCGVGCEFEADDANSQEICDPIHDNQQIYRMEVKKIFQSAARPVLVETFDQQNQSIGQFILKEGDDLRQDENMMFMFQLSFMWYSNSTNMMNH